MPAKQTLVVKTTSVSKTKTNKNTASNTKKGNPNKCTKCGKFV